MICHGAMEEESDDGVVRSWAENIRRLRSRTVRVPREADPERARDAAVRLAKECDLIIRWSRLEKILESAAHQFLTVLGIAVGGLVPVGTWAPAASAMAHLVTENFVRPYTAGVTATINNAVTGSTVYL